mgnify:CR=1 FL=1
MFIGVLAFVVIFLMAFWMMLFLVGIIPAWIGAYFIDKSKGNSDDLEV